MATPMYSALNLQRIPLQGLRLENLATAPTSGNPGDMYYDTALGYARISTGSGVWIKAMVSGIVDADIAAGALIALSKLATDPLARANHTGTQLASTVSNFDTQVRTSRLDQMVAPTAAVSMGSQKITNLADPTTGTDAATQQWVTNQLSSVLAGQDWKSSVRVRATTSVTLATPGATIDGITMVAGDRILLTGQSTASENGIWVWNGAASALTRASDASTSAMVTAGLTVAVEAGTGADSIWLLTTDNPIVLGTTALAFSQISGAGAYAAGTGLTLTGNSFALTSPVTVLTGGTGSTTAAGARTNLGVAQKGYAADVPAITAGTPVTLTHGLGTADCLVMIRQITGGLVVDIDTVITSTQVQITSAVDVAVSTLRAVVIPVS